MWAIFLFGLFAQISAVMAASIYQIEWNPNYQIEDSQVVVGDSIVFQYESGQDLYQMPSVEAFDVCDFTGAKVCFSAEVCDRSSMLNLSFLQKLAGDKGPKKVAFKEPGTFYFACSVKDHCRMCPPDITLYCHQSGACMALDILCAFFKSSQLFHNQPIRVENASVINSLCPSF